MTYLKSLLEDDSDDAIALHSSSSRRRRRRRRPGVLALCTFSVMAIFVWVCCYAQLQLFPTLVEFGGFSSKTVRPQLQDQEEWGQNNKEKEEQVKTKTSCFSSPPAAAIVRNETAAAKGDCMVVYHIPKTGGSTLNATLNEIARQMHWRYSGWYGEEHVKPTIPPAGNYYTKHVIHAGHFTPLFEKQTRTENCHKLTILREPIQRVISAFYYHKHKTPEWPACWNHTCKSWYQYENDMVRQMSAYGPTWNQYDIETYLVQGNLPRNDSARFQQVIEEAQAWIETFDFVCFINDLKTCARDISQRFGLSSINFDSNKVVNRGRRRPHKISDDVLQTLAEVNAYDVQLYQWATTRFSHSPRGGATAT